MDLSDVVKNALPTIATAFGGPLAGLAAKFVTEKLGVPEDTVENVTAILNGMNPEKLGEWKVHEQEFQLALAKLGYEHIEKIEELNLRAAEAVNKTMQAEAAAEHWPTYTWRPMIGFAVAFNLIASSIVVFIAYIFKPDLVTQIPGMLTAQAGLNAVALPVLGVASYFRGKMQADPSIPTTNKG